MAERSLPGSQGCQSAPENTLPAEASNVSRQENTAPGIDSISCIDEKLPISLVLASSAAGTHSQSTTGRSPIRAFTTQEGLQPRQREAAKPDFEVNFEQDLEPQLPLPQPQTTTEIQPSSLQPGTPPLTSPSGASPASRPASTCGETSEDSSSSSTGRGHILPAQEIVESIRAAIKSELRYVL